MLFGVTTILVSSKVQELGISWGGITISWSMGNFQQDVKCCGTTLQVGMAKMRWMEHICAFLKREFHKEQLKPHGVKIQKAHEVVNFLQSKFNKCA
jgi:hypothetical protein